MCMPSRGTVIKTKRNEAIRLSAFVCAYTVTASENENRHNDNVGIVCLLTWRPAIAEHTRESAQRIHMPY